MSTQTHPPFIMNNFKLQYYSFSLVISLLIILSFSLMNCYALALGGRNLVEKISSHDDDYDTFDVTSLLSTSTCQPSVQGVTSRPASLKVTHMYGPCSKLNQGDKKVPTLAEVLTRDQIRVASIQNRHASNAELDKLGSSKATIPARSGTTFGTGNYVVSIGLGTPAKHLSLELDTGSTLTWTQCKPCVKSCYKQKDPIFDPSASSSYSNVSCEAAECSRLTDTGYKRDCSASTCVYGTRYSDQSFSVGFLANERLTLTPHDVFDEFPFGCGGNNRHKFGNLAGILGLGRGLLSVVSETAQKYGKYFSYCLPTKSGSNGHLTFGKSRAPTNLVFTPFESSPQGSSFYFVKVVAISVAERQLPISPSVFKSGKTVIDSGTVITRLPPTIYNALQDAFMQHMSKYPSAPSASMLDTCYDFSNYTTVTIPKISIIFAGNVKVNLGFTGMFIVLSRSQVCFAFAGNHADTDTAIYGNVQQQTFEIAYDVAGGRLGFGPDGCS